MQRSLPALGLIFWLVVVSVNCPAQTKEEAPLVVGTLRHDGLLRPWAIFVDSTFRPVYSEQPNGAPDATPWIARSTVDSVRIWHVREDDGWLDVSTGELRRFDNTCMEYGFGYETSVKPYKGPLSCPPWRYGNAFNVEVASSVFSSISGRDSLAYLRLVGPALVDSVAAKLGGEVRQRDLDLVTSVVEARKLSSNPIGALVDGVQVEYGETSVPVNEAWVAEIDAWMIHFEQDTLLTPTFLFGDPKGSWYPNPMTLIRYAGRYFVFGEVWYWEGSDPAIWEIRDGKVRLLLRHQEYRD